MLSFPETDRMVPKCMQKGKGSENSQTKAGGLIPADVWTSIKAGHSKTMVLLKWKKPETDPHEIV
jgi:hypothetical protein